MRLNEPWKERHITQLMNCMRISNTVRNGTLRDNLSDATVFDNDGMIGQPGSYLRVGDAGCFEDGVFCHV
jgi:hypothetical protein